MSKGLHSCQLTMRHIDRSKSSKNLGRDRDRMQINNTKFELNRPQSQVTIEVTKNDNKE